MAARGALAVTAIGVLAWRLPGGTAPATCAT